MSVITFSHYEKYDDAVCPSYRLKLKYPFALLWQLCSTHFPAVWIKNCLKSTSVIKVAAMKYTDNLHYAKELAITWNYQINVFHC